MSFCPFFRTENWVTAEITGRLEQIVGIETTMHAVEADPGCHADVPVGQRPDRRLCPLVCAEPTGRGSALTPAGKLDKPPYVLYNLQRDKANYGR